MAKNTENGQESAVVAEIGHFPAENQGPGTIALRRMPISALLPADYNPRKALKPGDKEFEALNRSIEEFGLVDPLIWNETTETLVGGHQRLTVLKYRGCTEVDVSVVHLSLEREKALNVALNKIEGAWDNKNAV